MPLTQALAVQGHESACIFVSRHRQCRRVKHRNGAREAALKLLGYQSYPERKLVDKLTEKNFAPEDIHDALQDLKRLVSSWDRLWEHP